MTSGRVQEALGASHRCPPHRPQLVGLGQSAPCSSTPTLVRLVLVTANMELLGDRNWWLPPWLDRILPEIHVDGGNELGTELDALTHEQPAPGELRGAA